MKWLALYGIYYGIYIAVATITVDIVCSNVKALLPSKYEEDIEQFQKKIGLAYIALVFGLFILAIVIKLIGE